VESRKLMEPACVAGSIKLLIKRENAVQARGRTKVSTNLRCSLATQPHASISSPRKPFPLKLWPRRADGRKPRTKKRLSNEPQETRKRTGSRCASRRGRPVKPAPAAETSNTTQPGDETHRSPAGVARFVELDLADPVREERLPQTAPARMVRLNRVSDPAGDKPQYLWLRARTGRQVCDSRPCAFTRGTPREPVRTAFIGE